MLSATAHTNDDQKKSNIEASHQDSQDLAANEFFSAGKKAYEKEEFTKALNFFTKAISISKDKSNKNYLLARAKTYEKLNELTLALADCHTTITREPQNIEALFCRSRIHKKLNMDPLSKADLDAAMHYLRIKKEKDVFFETYIKHNALMAEKRVREAAQFAYCGYMHYENKNFQQTIRFLTKAIAISPIDWASYLFRGKALFHLKEYQKAINDLTHALEFRFDLKAAFFRAICYREAGSSEDAEQDFVAVITNDDNAQLQPEEKNEILSFIHSKSVYVEKNISPSVSETLDLKQAKEKLEHSDYTAAIKLFSQLILHAPTHPDYYIWRACAYYAEDKLNHATYNLNVALWLSHYDNTFSLEKKLRIHKLRRKIYFDKYDLRSANLAQEMILNFVKQTGLQTVDQSIEEFRELLVNTSKARMLQKTQRKKSRSDNSFFSLFPCEAGLSLDAKLLPEEAEPSFPIIIDHSAESPSSDNSQTAIPSQPLDGGCSAANKKTSRTARRKLAFNKKKQKKNANTQPSKPAAPGKFATPKNPVATAAPAAPETQTMAAQPAIDLPIKLPEHLLAKKPIGLQSKKEIAKEKNQEAERKDNKQREKRKMKQQRKEEARLQNKQRGKERESSIETAEDSKETPKIKVTEDSMQAPQVGVTGKSKETEKAKVTVVKLETPRVRITEDCKVTTGVAAKPLSATPLQATPLAELPDAASSDTIKNQTHMHPTVAMQVPKPSFVAQPKTTITPKVQEETPDAAPLPLTLIKGKSITFFNPERKIEDTAQYEIPIDAIENTILTLLESNGEKAFLVGGAVRERLQILFIQNTSGNLQLVQRSKQNPTSKQNKTREIDIDIVTSTPSKLILQLLKDYKPEPNKNDKKSWRISLSPSHKIDIWCSSQLKTSLLADANQRDFTIGALYADKNKKLYDPTQQGIKDLYNNVLRSIIPAKESFEVDALRILRAIYFQVSHNFILSADVKEAILQKKNLMYSINPPGRLNYWMLKLLSHDAENYFLQFIEYRIIQRLFPFIDQHILADKEWIIGMLKEFERIQDHKLENIYSLFVICAVMNDKSVINHDETMAKIISEYPTFRCTNGLTELCPLMLATWSLCHQNNSHKSNNLRS